MLSRHIDERKHECKERRHAVLFSSCPRSAASQRAQRSLRAGDSLATGRLIGMLKVRC